VKLDLERSGSWIGMSGMAVAFFLYAYSAVVVTDVVTAVLLPAFWIALLLLGFRWFMSRPYRVLVLPVVAIGVWFGTLWAAMVPHG
jgi:hypothetical protein